MNICVNLCATFLYVLLAPIVQLFGLEFNDCQMWQADFHSIVPEFYPMNEPNST